MLSLFYTLFVCFREALRSGCYVQCNTAVVVNLIQLALMCMFAFMWHIITWQECAMQHRCCFMEWLLINDVVSVLWMLVLFMWHAFVIECLLVLRHLDSKNIPIVR